VRLPGRAHSEGLMEHTKGLRIKIAKLGGKGAGWVVALPSEYTGRGAHKQAALDGAYINTLIEQDEARQAAFQQLQKTDEDLLVNVGNMAGANLNQCSVNAEYEAMVEDYLGCFNHMVAQGVAPIRAVYAACQSFAIVLGCCLRADMPFEVARQLVSMVMKTASTSEKMIRQITTSMSKQ
jgi:hypothetical protein